MATVNNDGLPSLADWVKKRDPNGAHARIVEVLTKKNPMLEDMVVKEGNLPTGHQVTTRTALPTPEWRILNQGVSPSKSKTAQVTEACGMLEGFSVVDTKLAKLNGEEAAFRAGEDMAHRAAMVNEVETGLFYHSTKTAPEKFMGLSPRLDATTGPGGSQIIKHDGAAAGADQASIWLVGWGEKSVYSIFPKGSMAGLQTVDRGVQLWDDGSGKKFDAYVTRLSWDIGLCVEDWRYLVRIANIDATNLAYTGNELIKSMARALEMIQDLNSVRPVFYCNRAIRTYLRLQAMDAVKNSTLTMENVAGKPVMMMGGVPVRMTDALLSTEAVIS